MKDEIIKDMTKGIAESTLWSEAWNNMTDAERSYESHKAQAALTTLEVRISDLIDGKVVMVTKQFYNNAKLFQTAFPLEIGFSYPIGNRIRLALPDKDTLFYLADNPEVLAEWAAMERAPKTVVKASEIEREGTQPKPNPDGLISWHGGENPVPGKMVEYKIRDSQYTAMTRLSDTLVWDHTGGIADIISYRVIEQ